MAVQITFNFNDAQQVRIQAARDAYNAENGTSLTNKQYLLTIIKDAVRRTLIANSLKSATATMDASVGTATAAIETDLAGNA